MLRHVVLLNWKENATDSDKKAVEEGLGELPAMIPEIRRYDFGADAGLTEGNYDFVLVADFETQADYELYQKHPAHLRVIQQSIRPAISARVGAQYWIPGSGD